MSGLILKYHDLTTADDVAEKMESNLNKINKLLEKQSELTDLLEIKLQLGYNLTHNKPITAEV